MAAFARADPVSGEIAVVSITSPEISSPYTDVLLTNIKWVGGDCARLSINVSI
jgi:hypothetical protein